MQHKLHFVLPSSKSLALFPGLGALSCLMALSVFSSHISNGEEARATEEEFLLSPLYFAVLPKTRQVRKTDLLLISNANTPARDE